MRATFVTGAADPTPYRYITPWREDPDVLSPELLGTDHPDRYPFDPMSLAQFVPTVWRVRGWEFQWTVNFNSQASGFSFIRAGSSLAVPTCQFPPTGVDGELGVDEEWRLGAGFRHQFIETFAGLIPEFPEATFTIQCFVGGRHQYIEGLENLIPQRFRPEVRFFATLVLNPDNPGNLESAEWNILSDREAGGDSCGPSEMTLTYWNLAEEVFSTYTASGGMAFVGGGQTQIISPSTFSARLDINAVEWWEYRDQNSENPIYDQSTGVPLLATGASASRSVSGQPVVNQAVVGGVRFVAYNPA